MKVNGYHQLFGYYHSSKYLLLCSAAQRNSYRFETTWGWENDNNFLFWVNYPFKTTFLISWRSPSCCQNSSDASRHEHHKTSERALWFLAQNISNRSIKSCMDQMCLSSTDAQYDIWGIWRPRQKPWTLCHVPQTLPEAFLHYHQGKPLRCTWSATIKRLGRWNMSK